MSTDVLSSLAPSISSQLIVDLDALDTQSEEKHLHPTETKGNVNIMGIGISFDYSDDDSDEYKEDNAVNKVIKPDQLSYNYSEDDDMCIMENWLKCTGCGNESRPELLINASNLKMRCPACKLEDPSFQDAERIYFRRREEIETKMNSDMESVVVTYNKFDVESKILALRLQIDDLIEIRKDKDTKLVNLGKNGSMEVDRALELACNDLFNDTNGPIFQLCDNKFCMIHYGKKGVVNSGKKCKKFTSYNINDPDRKLGFLHDYAKEQGYGWLRTVNTRIEVHAHVNDTLDLDFINDALCVAHPDSGWVDLLFEKGRSISFVQKYRKHKGKKKSFAQDMCYANGAAIKARYCCKVCNK
eukprot:553533_1